MVAQPIQPVNDELCNRLPPSNHDSKSLKRRDKRTGCVRRPATTSVVLYPLPVTQMTVGSSRGITPRLIRSIAAATVVPPAGSVKIPSVSASSRIPSMICSSETATPAPPVDRTLRTTW